MSSGILIRLYLTATKQRSYNRFPREFTKHNMAIVDDNCLVRLQQPPIDAIKKHAKNVMPPVTLYNDLVLQFAFPPASQASTSKTMIFLRPCTETVETLSNRIVKKLSFKKMNVDSDQPISISFLNDADAPIHPDMPISTALLEISTRLVIRPFNYQYKIKQQRFFVADSMLRLKPIVGRPTFVSYNLNKAIEYVPNDESCLGLFAQNYLMMQAVEVSETKEFQHLVDHRPESIKIHWFTSVNKNKPAVPKLDTSLQHPTQENPTPIQMNGWIYRQTCEYFSPNHTDTGRHVAAALDDPKHGIVTVVTSQTCVIDPSPYGEPLFKQRVTNLPVKSDDRLRLISYNILADLYLNLKLPKDQLFFRYCDVEFQKADYRYGLLLSEISDYNADIICLQEVDYRFYLRYLSRFFGNLGYCSLLRIKGFQVNEGETILFRNERFEHLASESKLLSDILSNDMRFSDLHHCISQTESTREIISTKPAIIQVEILRDRSSAVIYVVGNTHLHYNPSQAYIKLIQFAIASRHLEHVVDDIKNKYQKNNIVVFFCGDFNMTHNSGGYRLITTGHLDKNWHEWNTAFTNSEDESDFNGVNLTVQPMRPIGGNHEYTNYTVAMLESGETTGFAGSLDHIFYATHGSARVEEVYYSPMPQHKDVIKYQAIPSPLAPSDHLPLITDLNIIK